MEIKLTLSKKDNNLVLSDNDSISIELINYKIDTKEVYDKIYSKIPFDDNSIAIILETYLSEKEDLNIFKQLKMLFEKIDEAVNKQLNP